jgi:hypothetical protein
MTLKRTLISTLAAMAFASGCSTMNSGKSDQGTFFDDFNYSDAASLKDGGWIVRDQPGLPGMPGAKWGPDTVTVTDDPDHNGNRLVRMSARTDGTAEGTAQAQLCHERKYLEGTYAAHLRFYDQPAVGPDGDVVVQSFYVISPLRFDFDPKFSELDWEYLPNGGWGDPKTRLYSTSWQTIQPEPWNAFNQHHEEAGTMNGWHTLMMQVNDGKIHYFMDGKPFDIHGGRNYPVVPMSINFNLWYVVNGLLPGVKGPREYHEDIDWVFHARNRVLSPSQVDAEIAKLRNAKTSHLDTVPAADPVLPSTCNF